MKGFKPATFASFRKISMLIPSTYVSDRNAWGGLVGYLRFYCIIIVAWSACVKLKYLIWERPLNRLKQTSWIGWYGNPRVPSYNMNRYACLGLEISKNIIPILVRGSYWVIMQKCLRTLKRFEPSRTNCPNSLGKALRRN